MRIGINTLFMLPNKVGGTETYLRGLIYGLSKVDNENEYILFTNQENHETFNIRKNNFLKCFCNIPARFKTFRIFYEQTILPIYIKKNKIEVLHTPGYVSPLLLRCAKIVTIHDMQYFYFPKNLPKLKLLYWKYFIPISAQKSDIIITISYNSKKDISKFLGIPEEKIIVTYAASKFSIDGLNNIELNKNILIKYGIENNYILSVASFLPHKNIEGLIKAFALIKNKINHQLVLVGIKGHALKKIKETIMKSELEKYNVLILGQVSDKDLFTLYKKASLFILPSFFEGFGIPLVEAMSLGCPIGASDRTSIPEIVGNAGVLFNPEDIQSIIDAIYKILSNKIFKDNLIKRGYERVKMFSWEKMAYETIKAYRIAYENILKNKLI